MRLLLSFGLACLTIACKQDPPKDTPPIQAVPVASPSTSAPPIVVQHSDVPFPEPPASAPTHVTAIKGDVQVSAAKATAPISGADRVFAGLRGRFRQCYVQMRKSDPSVQGETTLTAVIAPDGTVQKSTLDKAPGSDDFHECLTKSVMRATFDAPGGKGSTLAVHLTFTPIDE